MPVKCHIEATDPVLIVRLEGVLRLDAASSVWHALAKLLSEQPDVVVVDLSAVVVEEPRALLVLAAVGRRASYWPGVPVILAVPSQPLRGDLTRLGIDSQVAVCAGREEAIVFANSAPAPPRLRERLQPIPGAARRARDLATEACLRWRLTKLIPPACVIASELVTNAVRHAGTPLRLSLARTARYLHIAVRDEDPHPAVLQHPSVLATRGRGLLIVQRTALNWGSTPAPTGKVVWATLLADAS